ncbi:hypothetical protein ACFFX0_14610 [Citricoccus parietis]|uniref:Uncharacterized protein n=1 Tax=Citricoccus parietis TaxID=592307 RepID=A0ABV5G0C1_9MICC
MAKGLAARVLIHIPPGGIVAATGPRGRGITRNTRERNDREQTRLTRSARRS